MRSVGQAGIQDGSRAAAPLRRVLGEQEVPTPFDFKVLLYSFHIYRYKWKERVQMLESHGYRLETSKLFPVLAEYGRSPRRSRSAIGVVVKSAIGVKP